jgi:hypothetical protein
LIKAYFKVVPAQQNTAWNQNILRGESWMKKLVASFILVSLVLVLASCSMEQKCPEGECEAPEGVEKKHE